MNKFILGVIIGVAAILFWIYRKKIFVFAQDTPGNGNNLIYSKTDKSTLTTTPGSEGEAIGNMIKSFMMKNYGVDSSLGTQDDSMLDNRKYQVSTGDNYGANKIDTLKLDRTLTNAAVLKDWCQCGCGCCQGDCPNQFDIV